MIQLRFNSLAGTDPAVLGPAPYFRIAGPLLQQGPERSVVARYADHHWEIGSRFVSSYESVEAVVLHFEGPGGESSGLFGPFQQVRFPNGSCYTDHNLFAELVEERGGPIRAAAEPHAQWLHRADLKRWPVLIVSPVEPGTTPR